MGQFLLTGLWLEKCFTASPQLLLISHMRHCASSTVHTKALSSEAEQCRVQCNDCALCVPCNASLASCPQWPRPPQRPVGDWRPAVVFEHHRHVHSARAELRTPRRCELVLEWRPSAARVARKERVEQCIIRVPHTDARVSDVLLLNGGTHIALALCRKENLDSHIVCLFAESQLNAWRVAHEFCFDTTPGNIVYLPRLCVSRNLLLCVTPIYSRRLVALEVTRDSKLVQTRAVQFDSAPSDLCAFTAGNEQLVATAHADRTVRLWRHVKTAA